MGIKITKKEALKIAKRIGKSLQFTESDTLGVGAMNSTFLLTNMQTF